MLYSAEGQVDKPKIWNCNENNLMKQHARTVYTYVYVSLFSTATT